jgi:hypothetical protein
MDLYTSLTRLKQAMNGGQLPPMTPLTEAAKKIIDPALTIGGDGAGGIVADEQRGLQCPVRGCGKYFHDLARHIATTHKSIGLPAFREAMSIPTKAPLQSDHMLTVKREGMKSRGTFLKNAKRFGTAHRRTSETRRARTRSTNAASMGARNLRDRCVAQLSHKLIDLANTLGRSPSSNEARTILGAGVVTEIIQTFGTWNNAKAQCGLSTLRPGGQKEGLRDAALSALEAWVEEHGDLPDMESAYLHNATPMLPPPNVFRMGLGSADWGECMRRAASLLDFHGGKYGLPEKSA